MAYHGHGLLHDIPVDKVETFEKLFLQSLALNHRSDVLDVLKQGIINDEVTAILEETAVSTSKQIA